MPTRTSVWEAIRTTAQVGDSNAVMALGCPRCNGPLSISYDPASPQVTGGVAGCLTIHCYSCNSGATLDGISLDPFWVESLGLKIDTRPSVK
jgi:hypothetical protein